MNSSNSNYCSKSNQQIVVLVAMLNSQMFAKNQSKMVKICFCSDWLVHRVCLDFVGFWGKLFALVGSLVLATLSTTRSVLKCSKLFLGTAVWLQCSGGFEMPPIQPSWSKYSWIVGTFFGRAEIYFMTMRRECKPLGLCVAGHVLFWPSALVGVTLVVDFQV